MNYAKLAGIAAVVLETERVEGSMEDEALMMLYAIASGEKLVVPAEATREMIASGMGAVEHDKVIKREKYHWKRLTLSIYRAMTQAAQEE